MFRLSIKLLFSALLLMLIFWNIQSKDLLIKLSTISFWAVISALLCLIVQSFLVSIRWKSILTKCSRELPLVEVIKMHYISLGASLFLPNLIAEPALKSILTRKFNVTLNSSVLSVVLDKLFVVSGLIVMTLFVTPVILVLYNPSYEFKFAYLVVLLCLSVIYILMIIFRYVKPVSFIKNYFNQYELLTKIVNMLVIDFDLILRCIVITVLSQIASTTAFFILTLSMGTTLTYMDCLLLITPAQLITTLPVAFNGWGVREVSIIYMLNIVDFPTDSALVLSIQYGLIGMLLWSIGLLSWTFIRSEYSIKTDPSKNVIN